MKRSKGTKCYNYRGAAVEIRVIFSWFHEDEVQITVWARRQYGGSDFQGPKEALRYIQARLSTSLVHSNDWALRGLSERPSLSLIVGGAA